MTQTAVYAPSPANAAWEKAKSPATPNTSQNPITRHPKYSQVLNRFSSSRPSVRQARTSTSATRTPSVTR